MRVKGEKQVYLLCELLKFLPAEYTPERSLVALYLDLDLLE